MIFLNQKTKEPVKVLKRVIVQDVSTVEFVLLDKYSDKEVVFQREEDDFRRNYNTEDAINKSPESYYFLNEIPSSIIDIENISSYSNNYKNDTEGDNCTISMIDDFNFE